MESQIVELLAAGAKANQTDPYRQGNLICLPPDGSLVVSGDIHGHARNLQRIISYADLEARPERHLIIHEIIHGGPQDGDGGCLSYKALFEAVELKLRYPDKVHILLGNHDTAFITGSEVLREGRRMNKAFTEALKAEFGQDWPQVQQAIRQFLLSQPLAARTANRIWISHSLPSDRMMGRFDIEVLSRPLQEADLQRDGPAYVLTWGRHTSQEGRRRLAEKLGVDLFVVGHQPQPDGWLAIEPDMLVLASDHNHGCLLELDLSASYDLASLVSGIILLSSID
ncbi:MAG: metallophosphoesterase [Sedimentisphaerales bacterium]|jgi:hypothetical protein|nr:metallophosphoesterase [Sedimentisphaerales bacterium]